MLFLKQGGFVRGEGWRLGSSLTSISRRRLREFCVRSSSVHLFRHGVMILCLPGVWGGGTERWTDTILTVLHGRFEEIIDEAPWLVQAVTLSYGHTIRVPLKSSLLCCDREGRITSRECCRLLSVPRLSKAEVSGSHLTLQPALFHFVLFKVGERAVLSDSYCIKLCCTVCPFVVKHCVNFRRYTNPLITKNQTRKIHEKRKTMGL